MRQRLPDAALLPDGPGRSAHCYGSEGPSVPAACPIGKRSAVNRGHSQICPSGPHLHRASPGDHFASRGSGAVRAGPGRGIHADAAAPDGLVQRGGHDEHRRPGSLSSRKITIKGAPTGASLTRWRERRGAEGFCAVQPLPPSVQTHHAFEQVQEPSAVTTSEWTCDQR